MATQQTLLIIGIFVLEEQHPNFWYVKGKEALHTSLSMKPNLHRAKNLILFLGDGMGISTVTAARIMKGQMEGKTGEESVLAMDTFPHLALSKTYNVDQQMPDSAATATAYHCGVKANYGTLGLSAAARRKDCSSVKGNEVKSILHQAKMVILGGGRQYMFPNETVDPEYSTFTGSRQDKTNLVDVWLRSKNNAKYVWNKKDFDAVKEGNTDYLMGLFEPKDTRYELERDPSMDPSLTEMVEKAIKILRKNSKGFYLFVEDKIDHGHHAGQAKYALTEAVEFDRAIARAAELTSELDTLSVVTADHSHVFSFGGYSYRGNPVLGVSYSKAEDGKSFTNALYGNGPGYQIANGTRPDMNATSSDEYLQQAAVPLDSETHGSEDVAIFAKGPMAHLFHGVQEQSYIPHAMAYAACIEPYTDCQLENYVGTESIQTPLNFSLFVILQPFAKII
uniref:alkaline phosphatase n=1 Tax=Sinocyclocheilus rhinocerous TaxID=307959 RepID=A0A673LTG8_9TELE